MSEPPKMDLLQSKNDGSLDSASGIKLSELSSVIAENYNKYHQTQQQLKSLQEWILQQQQVYQ